MLNIECFRNRGCEFTFQLFDADGAPITPDSQDVTYVAIGRSGTAPLLQLSTAGATANGSTVTVSGDTFRVHIEQEDANTLPPGVWDLEPVFDDASLGNRYTPAVFGTLTVYATQRLT